MFSFGEIVIIFALGLVVLGPKKLPAVAAQIGRWLGRARAMARQFREQLEQEVNTATDLESRARRDQGARPRPGAQSDTAGPAQAPSPATPAAAAPSPSASDHRDLGAASNHTDLGAAADHRDLGATSAPLEAAPPASQEPLQQSSAASTAAPAAELTEFPTDPTYYPAPDAAVAPAEHSHVEATEDEHAPREAHDHDHSAHPELEVYAPATRSSRERSSS